MKTLALGGAAMAGPLSAPIYATPRHRELPAGKRAGDFIIHNDLPWALETRRSSFGVAPITPQSAFFVRNNLPMPPESIIDKPDQWRFEIVGTNRAGRLTLGELKQLPIQVVATVLQCSGNGRAFFAHQPSGSPWGIGAAGCALWTGVRVADVVEALGGAAPEARFLTATGAEPLPSGVDPNQLVVERSIPLEKGLRDCLLAWEMNGSPLPLVHGGPLRLIVPGYYGVNNVKWVKRLSLTERESSSHIQASGYRFRNIGEAGGPQHPSMWRMPVKSWINGPGADGDPIASGDVVLHGVAFSGERGISSVDVSGDDGDHWQQAELLGPDLGPNAWRSFAFKVHLNPGEYRFVSRATDKEGDVQPRMANLNQRGYGHNAWHDAALTLQVVKNRPVIDDKIPLAPAERDASRQTGGSVELSSLARKGRNLFLERTRPSCGLCHRLDEAGTQGAIGPNLDTLRPSSEQVLAALSQGVGAMPSFASQLTETEMSALAAYITEATRP
ncbi:molybdopterin-dependent oxidoreductase [Parahaliea mediterranea]|uniref:molybdopterin-dependent oxidoreductase n=1 Tax=Parahaliea mediterranea TaxID=651086 RepID=UPI001F4E0436|nr:molybdopterin-dependent oxidoreductase [Parahaliea mediterranea]